MRGSSSLFEPIRVGEQDLSSRIVLPPLTRSRATDTGLATSLMAQYYRQRSGAGLIIAEGTVVLPQATAYPRVPGIYSEEQVASWRPVVEAAKSNGSTMYCQLWHVGRQSHSSVQPDGLPPKAPSTVAITGQQYRSPGGPVPYEVPRELIEPDIAEIVDAFGRAARNALRAGFDGVELHGANGYLIEQFLDDGINLRTDKYGGSIANRMRFLEEVLQEVFEHVPPHRVGVRLSPSSDWMDAIDSDKRTLFSTVIRRLDECGLAYLHLVEPGIAGATSAEESSSAIPTSELAQLFTGPVIVTGGHTFHSAQELIDRGVADMVGFGRLFIANPDLPTRFAVGAPLQEVRKKGLYGGAAEGYTDYPSLAAEK
ncbi:alkene reductase [Brevibacterium atlanticum]|uniref:alkene reductase n=1 Tax=Brevibacterium atlanticum TaxID=2697563 RepID=UPI001422BC47|nr:alkene reductase [Brevibacterium atlanticum]